MKLAEHRMHADAPTRVDNPDEGVLRVIPLGGLGNIGKNMMALEYGDDLILIDAGSLFPHEETPGVDLIIPDVEYVLERRERLRAILLTHGHEDHIGTLPFLLEFGIAVPIYGADLTIGIVESKFADENVSEEALKLLHKVDVESRLDLGAFQAEFFQVNHSFPSSMGLAIQTPLGRIIHTGDFKFDDNPVLDKPIDEVRLRQWGDEGVLLLMADSTNAEETVATSSETTLEDTLQSLLAQAPGRIFLTTFASNISRVQQVIQLAHRNGRRVGLVGRSMFRYVGNAIDLGYLDIRWSDLLNTSQIENEADTEVLVLVTGSQGEQLSALNRMSLHSHRDHGIRSTDTIIISAEPIPGNEVRFYSMVNRLFQQGADVIYSNLADIHVSGHGSLRENERMLTLVRPRFFVPVHGEYRHLVLNKRNAITFGMPEEDIFILADGQILELKNETATPGAQGTLAYCDAWLGAKIPVGQVLVDGSVISDDAQILQERKWLRDGGVLGCVVVYDAGAESLRGAPDIFTRGLLYPEERDEFHERARHLVSRQFRRSMRQNEGKRQMEQAVQRVLNRYCRQELGRRPVIVVRLITA